MLRRFVAKGYKSLHDVEHRLQSNDERAFASIRRTLRSIVPTVEDLSVDLDEKRGLLDIQVMQDGTLSSSRVLPRRRPGR